MEIHTTIRGTNILKRKLALADRELNSIGEDTIRELAEYTQATAQALAPKDLGMGANGIYSEVSGLHAQVTVDELYMVVMNQGRAPGSAAPPVQALIGWGSRHGFDTPGDVFVLARSIGRRGIRARRYMEKAAHLARARMEVQLGEAKIRVEKWFI